MVRAKENGRREVRYRNLNGEGGKIREVTNRNLYKSQIRVKVDGKSKRIDVYGKTRQEVLDKIREANRAAKLGISPTNKETVAHYLERWYPTGKGTDGGPLRQKSIDSRLVNINRMLPHIGALKLRELTAIHIQAMYDQLKEELKDYSVKQVHAVLSKAMKDAAKEGSIAYNPIEKLAAVPTASPFEVNPLTIDEVNRLLSVNDQWTLLFSLLIFTGLRRGEALGLSWKNVNLDGGKPTLKVEQTVVSTRSNGVMFSKPKTAKSNREVTLNPQDAANLAAIRTRQIEQCFRLGTPWNPSGLVFPNSVGGPMEPAVVNRALKRHVGRVGIDRHVRVHDLRSTCGSLMHQNGVDAKEIQEVLGHEDIQTTLNLYVKTNPEMLRDATDRLYKAITG
jgi:integrase